MSFTNIVLTNHTGKVHWWKLSGEMINPLVTEGYSQERIDMGKAYWGNYNTGVNGTVLKDKLVQVGIKTGGHKGTRSRSKAPSCVPKISCTKLSPWEQNFQHTTCSIISNMLNTWGRAPAAD